VQPSVVTIFTDGGLGSGVVYSAEGLILTNEHVVRGQTDVEVAFPDGRRVAGTADHAFIGLTLGDITPQIAERLGLPDTRGAWPSRSRTADRPRKPHPARRCPR
jgi:S1-C subfamily serine protease